MTRSLDQQIKTAERNLLLLKLKRDKVSSFTEDQKRRAEMLHEINCHHDDHPGNCTWDQETWENPTYTRLHYILLADESYEKGLELHHLIAVRNLLRS